MKPPRLWVVEEKDDEGWWPCVSTASTSRTMALINLRYERRSIPGLKFRHVQYQRVEPRRKK